MYRILKLHFQHVMFHGCEDVQAPAAAVNKCALPYDIVHCPLLLMCVTAVHTSITHQSRFQVFQVKNGDNICSTIRVGHPLQLLIAGRRMHASVRHTVLISLTDNLATCLQSLRHSHWQLRRTQWRRRDTCSRWRTSVTRKFYLHNSVVHFEDLLKQHPDFGICSGTAVRKRRNATEGECPRRTLLKSRIHKLTLCCNQPTSCLCCILSNTFTVSAASV
jgi:hypothetical protein